MFNQPQPQYSATTVVLVEMQSSNNVYILNALLGDHELVLHFTENQSVQSHNLLRTDKTKNNKILFLHSYPEISCHDIQK